jgi:hypothetical protein
MTEESAVASIKAVATEPEKDWSDIGVVINEISEKTSDADAKAIIVRHLDALVAKFKMSNYRILMLFDERDDITHWHADHIYRGANDKEGKKDIF